MASRVDQIEFHVRKLAQATGIELEKKDENEQNNRDAAISTSGFDPSVFSSASTVTSDLDIEALSRGLLDISKDLDHYLQTLLEKPDSMLTIKSVSLIFIATFLSLFIKPTCSNGHDRLVQDIASLEAELQEKNELLEKSVEMVRKAEIQFRKLKARQLKNIYYM